MIFFAKKNVRRASDAAGASEEIFLILKFQTRARQVRFGSVNQTLPSGSDQVRFGWKIPDLVGS